MSSTDKKFYKLHPREPECNEWCNDKLLIYKTVQTSCIKTPACHLYILSVKWQIYIWSLLIWILKWTLLFKVTKELSEILKNFYYGYFRLYKTKFLSSTINKHIGLLCLVNGFMLPVTLTIYFLLFLSTNYGDNYIPSTISRETLCYMGLMTWTFNAANFGAFTNVSTVFRFYSSISYWLNILMTILTHFWPGASRCGCKECKFHLHVNLKIYQVLSIM